MRSSIIAAGAVIAVIVTLLILSGSSRARERRLASQVAAEEGRPAAASAREELALEDFLLPEARPAQSLPEYYPFRPRLQRWSREIVDKFWVSPRQVAVEVIGVVNDRNMEEFFKAVP